MDPNPAKRLRTAEEEEGEVRENGGGEQPEAERRKTADVSIIMPVHNASSWLEECLQAIMHQDFTGSMELSVFDDASTDDSRKVLEGWRERMEDRGISVVISGHGSSQPGGVGFAKNKAVTQSSGRYLCFQDADDIMLPQRVRLQYETSILHPNSVSFFFYCHCLVTSFSFFNFAQPYFPSFFSLLLGSFLFSQFVEIKEEIFIGPHVSVGAHMGSWHVEQ
uniref:UDP-GlcNAc:betaGal beta-1,3-N-acetylglucosaminyltransferase-like 1 n=1 Tax=Xiphophorus maculatus TaxID=8083 RepID=A0A3B5RFL8_XIPMA